MPARDKMVDAGQTQFFARLTQAVLDAGSEAALIRAVLHALQESIAADIVVFLRHQAAHHCFVLEAELHDYLPHAASDDIKFPYTRTAFAAFLTDASPLLNCIRQIEIEAVEQAVFGPHFAADLAVPVYAPGSNALLGVLYLLRATPISFNKLQKTQALSAAGVLAKAWPRQDDVEAAALEIAPEAATPDVPAETSWQPRAEALLDRADSAYCLVDTANDIITACNQKGAQTLGLKAKELEGSRFTRLFEEPRRTMLRQALETVRYKAELRLKKCPLEIPAGKSRCVDLRMAYIGDEAPQVVVMLSPGNSRRKATAARSSLKALNRLFACWRHVTLDGDASPQWLDGLQLFARALRASYALTLRVDGSKIEVAGAAKPEAPPEPAVQKATTAALIEAPYLQLASDLQKPRMYDIFQHPAFEAWRPVARQLAYTHLLLLPLRRDGELCAMLALFFDRERRFTPSQRRYLKAAAGYLEIAIARSHYANAAGLQSSHLQWFQQLAHRLRAQLDVDLIVEAAALGLQEKLPFEILNLSLFDSESDHVTWFRVASLEFAEQVGEASWQPFEEQAALGRLEIPERQEAVLQAQMESLARSRLHSLLISQDRYLGTLELFSSRVDLYGEPHKAILSQIADQLASALDHARLFERLAYRAAEATAIAHASRAVVEGADLRAVLSDIIRSIKQTLRAGETLVYLLEPAHGIESPVRIGDAEIPLFQEHLQTIQEKVVTKRLCYTIENIASSYPEHGDDGALLCCPIDMGDRVVGMIVIAWQQPRPSLRKEIELVRILSNLAAVAIAREQIRQEQAIRTSELEIVNEELERFVYTVSHDLKSPLVSIQGFAALLHDDYSQHLNEEARHYLERIQRNAEGMEQLVKNLLELSRIDRAGSHRELVNAQMVVDRVLLEASYLLREQQIQVEVAAGLPALYANPTQIKQVFANLIDNAIKFRDREKGQTRIEVRGESKAGEVVFCVADNGIGIRPDFQSRIFNMFEREKKLSEVEGSGLGLAIVKRILENHGGRIWVESMPGDGASFYFALPNHMQDVNQAPASLGAS